MAIVDLGTLGEKPSLGISACLMGDKVRYNGGHKRSSFCLNVLNDFFSFQKICPEMAIGLGVPREPVRLVGTADEYEARGTNTTGLNVTRPLAGFAKKVALSLDVAKTGAVSGYILMQKSPSCGMQRVKIYGNNGVPSGESGPGIFAKNLMEALPLLPVEEEGRLHDPVLRENFFVRVYAYHRWQVLLKSVASYRDIEVFHARYKYILMAHDPEGYGKAGRYLAENSEKPMAVLVSEYIRLFMSILGEHATRKSHTNVLLHLAGYLKKELSGKARQELLAVIEAYRTGMHPLVVPVRMLRSAIMQHGNDYVKNQYYLFPYPDGLGLRNTI